MKFQTHFTLLALDSPLKAGAAGWVWGAFTIPCLYVHNCW
jgi:hypothetical protein